MGESLTTRSACILLRLGVVGCLAAAAITLAADVSEYPSLNRAGIRALARGAFPPLFLGILNLIALDAPARPWRAVVTWLAVAGNVLLVLWAARFLAAGGPPMVWILGGTGALLLVGSVGCAVARRAVPPG